MKFSKLRMSERLENAPRIIYVSQGGGFIQVNNREMDRLLKLNGYRDPRVVRWQQNWQLSLLALVMLVSLLISGYQWGLPWAADKLAQHLPSTIEKKIGDEALALVDSEYMKPSKLDPAVQARLRKSFLEMKQPRAESTSYQLEFRRSQVGPNAFALPNGVIVMTDELVALAGDDRAVLGVLAHELGHLQRRHTLRRLLQTVGVGVVVNVFVGDVSSVLAAGPAFLLDQKYSRDMEREADQYAIEMMKANSISLAPMAALFERMGNAAADEHDDEEDQSNKGKRKKKHDPASNYFSSHPSDEERMATLRAGDAK